jgi:hypothetical protein
MAAKYLPSFQGESTRNRAWFLTPRAEHEKLLGVSVCPKHESERLSLINAFFDRARHGVGGMTAFH